MIRLIFVSIIILFGLTQCISSKRILYRYETAVVDSIYVNVFQQNETYRKYWIPNPKQSKIWVEMNFSDNHITMAFRNLCNPNENRKMLELLKKTNRYLLIKEYQIPIIFTFDTEYIDISTNNRKMIYRGYMIRFDNQGNIVLKGPVF